MNVLVGLVHHMVSPLGIIRDDLLKLMHSKSLEHLQAQLLAPVVSHRTRLAQTIAS